MVAEKTQKDLLLPVAVATKVDAGRLFKEATDVDEFMSQANIRQPGKAVAMPKTSKLMDQIVEDNKLNMLVEADRAKLLEFLSLIRENAPEVHMSFSTEPSPAFVKKITSYMRENIHPYVLVQIGLQPTIGAGFMMRTTNKYYDFSIRTTLRAKKDMLMKYVNGLNEQPLSVKSEEAA